MPHFSEQEPHKTLPGRLSVAIVYQQQCCCSTMAAWPCASFEVESEEFLSKEESWGMLW